MGFDDNNLPENTLQNVTIEGRKHLIVTGVLEVSRFDEDEIVLETVRGTLSVRGSDFRMERFSLDTGEVHAHGFVTGLDYETDEPSSGGFFSRLFR